MAFIKDQIDLAERSLEAYHLGRELQFYNLKQIATIIAKKKRDYQPTMKEISVAQSMISQWGIYITNKRNQGRVKTWGEYADPLHRISIHHQALTRLREGFPTEAGVVGTIPRAQRFVVSVAFCLEHLAPDFTQVFGKPLHLDALALDDLRLSGNLGKGPELTRELVEPLREYVLSEDTFPERDPNADAVYRDLPIEHLCKRLDFLVEKGHDPFREVRDMFFETSSKPT